MESRLTISSQRSRLVCPTLVNEVAKRSVLKWNHLKELLEEETTGTLDQKMLLERLMGLEEGRVWS